MILNKQFLRVLRDLRGYPRRSIVLFIFHTSFRQPKDRGSLIDGHFKRGQEGASVL